MGERPVVNQVYLPPIIKIGSHQIMKKSLTFLTVLCGLLAAAAVPAIEFDEVRNYGDVFVISADAPARDRVEVSWKIEPDYYLYNNRFLRFISATDGVVLGEPIIPEGEIRFDPLLGEEVEKYHDQLTIDVPLESVAPGVEAMQLNIRSQGCLEEVLCYPPTEQVVLVSLPRETAIADPLAGTSADLLAGPGQSGIILEAEWAPALQPEEAFMYEAIGLNAETALIRFTAQPGYYLYVDQFAFAVSGNDDIVVRAAELPEGVIKDDPEFGPVQVYFGQVEIPVRFNRPAGPALELELQADFQGCRDGDICYPPMSRTVIFDMPAASAAIGLPQTASAQKAQTSLIITPPVSEQDRLARLLTSNPSKAIFAFFLAGILLAFTPCVFPMVPILSGIIAGQGDRLTTAHAFWLSLVYVLAMAITYTVAGVLAGMFGQNLQAVFQNPWIITGFVLIFVLLALSMFGFYELQMPGGLQTKLTEASNRQAGGQIWGVAVMGFLSALIVGPCVAPPLMAALIVIGASGDATLGGTALFALSMGMGVPLILFGISAGKLVPKAGVWMDVIKAVFGIGLLALAIWMLERILPGGVIMLLWGALAIGCAIYLGALESTGEGASGWKRLWKSLGVVLLILGSLEIIGAAAGGDYWLKPLQGLRGFTGSQPAENQVEFRRIKSLEDLEMSLSQANAVGKGAMLDFYADRCVECIRMERNTFPESEVQSLLDRLQPLQADVTKNDQVDQALMKAFGIIGPPAILFFDRQGEEMKPWRLVGYFTPEEFSSHLEQVLAAQ
jgi:thiol:disulfide interchange protein DsbD